MILSTHGFVASSIGQFDADYQAVLNYATTQGYTLPSASQRILQNQLMISLKNAGVWSKLDTFAVFATDGNSGFALIDWKRLSQYTAVNSPTFTSNGGFTGNGTSSYISTNYNTLNAINYQGANACRFFWVDNRSGTTAFEGTNNNARNNSFNTNSASHRINAGFNSLNSAVNFAVDGHHAINRTSSTNVELFTGTTQFSRTQSGGDLDNLVQFILNTGTTYNASRMRIYGMGASLVSENTNLYNAVNTYLTSL
jgi:hypothetical protein